MIKSKKLNEDGLFESIRYTSYLTDNLTPNLQDRYLFTTKIVLEELASIKDNPPYCQFVSEEIGFDLQEGFKNLEGGPLNIAIKFLGHEYSDAHNFFKRSDFYAFELESSIYSLQHRTDQNLRTVIGHELGHSLIHAAEDGPVKDEFLEVRNAATYYRGGYSDDYRQNWKIEFAADKISIASNPENNNIGKQLSEHRNKRAWLNNFYQKGLIPKIASAPLASLSMKRDEAFIKYIGEDYDLGNKLNKAFKMNCTMTHPSDIARAVEGEKFAAKAVKFLKDQGR